MNIVLLEPEIPHNTGAIGRTCVLTGSRLHLIRPLGFSLDEKYLRRTGLDYWRMLSPEVYDDLDDFRARNPGVRPFMATTKAAGLYHEVSYDRDAFIMFGKESAGIPEALLNADRERCVRIPMLPMLRSLNLSVAAGIILYEALRQRQFADLADGGVNSNEMRGL